MNQVNLLARAATEIELRYSSGDVQTAVGNFRVAVNKKKGESDFFNCVAFGKTAENIAHYFHKGDRILIAGRLENDQYTNKEGKKVTSTKIVVEQFDFIEQKKEEPEEGFIKAEEEELPWKL